MNVLKSKTIVLLVLSATVMACLAINWFIVYPILIPDPCYYHAHKMNAVMKLLYSISTFDNFHPFPSVFNFGFTIVVGLYIGWKLNSKILRYD